MQNFPHQKTPMENMQNQTAIISGAGCGIGRAIALAFAKRGVNIAVCARSPDKVRQTAALCEKLGVRTYADNFDAGDEASVIAFIAKAAEICGAPTILIPNAAVMPVSDIVDMDVSDMDACYSTKVRSAALFTKHCIPHMKNSGGGSIAMMASVTGNVGFASHSFYGAMNAALIGFARGLAMELAPYGIRVNSVSPGTVDSPMLHQYIKDHSSNEVEAHQLRAAFDAAHPRGRVGSAEEVAETIAFLASPAAANITAIDLRCDGGFSYKGGQASSSSHQPE